MSCMFILDQLWELYGHPTPAILEQNYKVFVSPYLADNAPKVLFCCIKDCTEIALLGQDPYTNHQLINNAIHLLLMTGLYLRPFKEWDHLLSTGQTWIVLHTMIQELFQRRLNTTAPTAGQHSYALALPFQQDTFGALAGSDNSNNESVAASVAMQVAALTHQSQLTSSTVANSSSSSQRHNHQMMHIATQQDLMHQNMHQIIAQLNTVLCNVNNKGCGIGQFRGRGCGRGHSRECGHVTGCTRGGRFPTRRWIPPGWQISSCCTPHGTSVPCPTRRQICCAYGQQHTWHCQCQLTAAIFKCHQVLSELERLLFLKIRCP
jgi:hypothetical protein